MQISRREILSEKYAHHPSFLSPSLLLILPFFISSFCLPTYLHSSLCSFLSSYYSPSYLLSFLTSCILYLLLICLPSSLTSATSLNNNAHAVMNLLYPRFVNPQSTINIILLIVLSILCNLIKYNMIR